ncbi:hypothetical protein M758_3G269500 [Ceratodon purpureus]|nr:hypothetical protein M758_3G269500 [Ceratodon purpureus]
MAWGELCVESEEAVEEAASPPCKLHAVFLPFPAYSHVVQILHFARQLVHVHKFTATLITSTHYHNELMKSHAAGNGADSGLNGGIQFLHVSDGLPDDHPRLAGNLMHYVMAVYSMEPAVNMLLSDLHDKTPITCLVRDLHLPFMFKAPRDNGISIAAFAPNSAAKEYLNRSVRALIDEGFLPDAAKIGDQEQFIDWERPITCLEGVSSEIRVGDLPIWPSVKGKLQAAVVNSVERRTEQYVLSDWVVVNTVYELECGTVDAMRKQTPNVCTVGPLSLVDHNDDETCIDWLNDQEPGSVIIVAFGTTTMRSIDQFKEVAIGLEASEHKFLWVFSAEQVISDSTESERESFLNFMSGFTERTKNRGHITKWIPHFLATLRHSAVGAFLSHCGWHSVLEGIASGVPFLTWPFQYDHWPIARCVTHVWKIGLSMDSKGDQNGLVTRDEVERKVRRILNKTGEDMEVDAIRDRSGYLKSVTEKAITTGGTSQRSVASFVAAMRKKAKNST